jgi:hypothetical protein
VRTQLGTASLNGLLDRLHLGASHAGADAVSAISNIEHIEKTVIYPAAALKAPTWAPTKVSDLSGRPWTQHGVAAIVAYL